MSTTARCARVAACGLAAFLLFLGAARARADVDLTGSWTVYDVVGGTPRA